MNESPGAGGVVRILGTHGVPAAYGGFETAAQNVGLYLRDRGWRVVVYCQEEGPGGVSYDEWRGLERVRIQEPRPGWRGTAAFDLSSVRHVLAHATPGEVCLTFGYNTGVFNVAQRLRGIPNVINMDGMEWTRRRWGLARQAILLGNERFAGLFGDVLIGDHPEISAYLRRHFGARRVRTIAYGGHAVDEAPESPVTALGLEPGGYAVVICRPIPENSLLEIVRAWAARERAVRLVVLGDFSSADPYHQRLNRHQARRGGDRHRERRAPVERVAVLGGCRVRFGLPRRDQVRTRRRVDSLVDRGGHEGGRVGGRTGRRHCQADEHQDPGQRAGEDQAGMTACRSQGVCTSRVERTHQRR